MKQLIKQTLEKTYNEHKKIYSKELNEKIKELSSGQNDQWLHTELQNQKSSYVNQLIFKQTKN
jgi:hypothetical protein